MAENLLGLGISVTVLDAQPQVLSQIDRCMASFVHAYLREKGFKLVLGKGVAGFEEKDGMIYTAVTEGETLASELVIFAIGINDANVQHFNDKQFIEDYSRLVARIKRVAPDAAIIFETNNDMYRKVKKRRYVQHPNGEIARKAFFTLAEKHQAGVWDKFSLMGGLGSMAKWEKADLAKGDKVHFKLAGYNLLGDMFYKAFINTYMDHIGSLPAQEPVAPPPQPVKADTATPAAATAPAAATPAVVPATTPATAAPAEQKK